MIKMKVKLRLAYLILGFALGSLVSYFYAPKDYYGLIFAVCVLAPLIISLEEKDE